MAFFVHLLCDDDDWGLRELQHLLHLLCETNKEAIRTIGEPIPLAHGRRLHHDSLGYPAGRPPGELRGQAIGAACGVTSAEKRLANTPKKLPGHYRLRDHSGQK